MTSNKHFDETELDYFYLHIINMMREDRMFLDVTARRNPNLIDAAVELHQKGLLLPDTYILDLDTIEENT